MECRLQVRISQFTTAVKAYSCLIAVWASPVPSIAMSKVCVWAVMCIHCLVWCCSLLLSLCLGVRCVTPLGGGVRIQECRTGVGVV